MIYQAEQAVSLFFSKYHTSVKYISYDTIRTDNFLKHAPFDGLLVDCNKVSKTILAEKFEKINKEIAESSYGVISTELRAELYDAGIYTVEIKSTKVNDKKRTAASFVVIKPGKDRPRIYTKTYVNAKIDKDKNGGYCVKIVARESNMSSIALVDNEYSNDNAKKELGKIMDASAFDFPKPTTLIKKLISIVDKENITVLDFFAGSGTTGHAALDFNAGLTDGKCEFILVNNNENNICRNITYNRVKTVIEKEQYKASLKYFKIDYVDIDSQQYYEYADQLLLHVKELVELENGIDFNTDKRIKIILTDEELRQYIDGVFKDNPCRTIYLGHNVLLPIEDEKKLIARRVEIRRIPDYYYGELK